MIDRLPSMKDQPVAETSDNTQLSLVTDIHASGGEPAFPASDRRQTEVYHVVTGIYHWDTFAFFTIFILFNQLVYILCLTITLRNQIFVTPT